jgi:RNA polymerase sigma factor (TIGR02999 family)
MRDGRLSTKQADLSEPIKLRGDITLLLHRMGEGDGRAADELFSAVYADLRRRAKGVMRNRSRGNTLQPTALVHEAFLKLVEYETDWKSRAHFLGVAAKAMQRILVDHARSRSRRKRRTAGRKIELDDLVVAFEERAIDLERLDAAMKRLATRKPRAAEVVRLRFFGGLQWREIAEVVGAQKRAVERDWEYARAWLHAELTRRM